MISPASGKFLYSLCYMQSETGDVVEIGSWQGRSTSFLARAVKESGNGQMFAIDHFKGNVGKQSFYTMKKDDLSDLKEGFVANMNRVGLGEVVTLLDMPNDQAERELREARIRFLFVDGDHTRSGLERDISLFLPKLVGGAILVFDDFSPAFPGVVEAVDDLLGRIKPARVMCYQNTIAIKL